MQDENDPCCFKHPMTGMRVVVWPWVDDVITRGTLEHTHDFYSRLNSKYPLRSWNILSSESPLKHLGFDITEEVVDGQLHA